MSTTEPVIARPPHRHWQRRKHARVSEILAAAAAIFAEAGESGLKMSSIAERAGVTKGTIYLYFANKAELVARLSENATAMQAAE